VSTINTLIKAGSSEVFRTIEIKRRDATTGLFEPEWQDISADVKKWGVIKSEIDAIRLNKFKFANMKTTFINDTGKYNEESDPASFWFGFLPQQRTLVRFKAGFFKDTLTADGIWQRNRFPDSTVWDGSSWDQESSQWDNNSTTFVGMVSGDILGSDSNQITLNIRPTVQIFRDYAAKNLTAYDSSMTASKFMEMVRDHQDVNGNYIFRPFFGDTTTEWEISNTTAIYPDLNTSTANDVVDSNVWKIIEKLAEAENHVVYTNKNGKFIFKNKDDLTTTAFEFHGLNSLDTQFGHTIKKISSYGPKISKLYTRVEIQHNEASTSTSFEVREATLTVSANSTAWIYGQKTLSIKNFFMDATLAESLATSIFNEVSALKNEIKFSSSFVPQLDVLDRATITYNSGEFSYGSLWDLNNWGDTTSGIDSGDLVWNDAQGDALDFTDKEFKILSYEIDLDKLESRFIAREV